jgi:DNA mismatch endonuclease (patch repair protein)
MTRKKINNYLGRNFKKKRTADKISKERRSAVMSKIRSRETKFEEDFIQALKRATKMKFEKNVHVIKGKPDIVFKKAKICVFLDSDFWHGWQYPRWKHLLKNDFWRDKIENNRNRDKKTTTYLRRKGWTVIRIWEHSIRMNNSTQIDKILRLFNN